MRLICIAGGTGSGKSTLAIALHRRHPELVTVLHLDDYFRRSADVARVDGFINWEHPDSVDFDRLAQDLAALARGTSVTVRTRSELYNPDFDRAKRNFVMQQIDPAPVIVLEGYLSLHDARIRALMDYGIYLDMPVAKSSLRRAPDKDPLPDTYVHKLLIPQHEEFVVATKQYANRILEVSGMTRDDVQGRAEEALASILPPEQT